MVGQAPARGGVGTADDGSQRAERPRYFDPVFHDLRLAENARRLQRLYSAASRAGSIRDAKFSIHTRVGAVTGIGCAVCDYAPRAVFRLARGTGEERYRTAFANAVHLRVMYLLGAPPRGQDRAFGKKFICSLRGCGGCAVRGLFDFA